MMHMLLENTIRVMFALNKSYTEKSCEQSNSKCSQLFDRY